MEQNTENFNNNDNSDNVIETDDSNHSNNIHDHEKNNQQNENDLNDEIDKSEKESNNEKESEENIELEETTSNEDKKREMNNKDELKDDNYKSTINSSSSSSNPQKNRRQLTLPVISMTEMNEFNNSKTNQLVQQSYSLETSSTSISPSSQMNTVITTIPSSSAAAAAPTEVSTTMNNDDDNNRNNCTQKFKTKRFYETDDDNILMTQIFSQTIRSTSVTPTDECDVNELLADIANRVTIQQQSQQQSIMSTSTTTIISTSNYDQKSIPSIKTTPSPPPLASLSSPTFSSMNYNMNDTDNYSATEYSNAESQTDNIEMYNEPNMSSLLDNLQSDCEEFVDKSDTEDITDPDYNPWDVKSKSATTSTTGTATTIVTDLNNCNKNQSLSLTTRSTSTTSSTLKAFTSLSSSTDNNNQMGPIKRRPSIVVEFYNDDLTKNVEYEVEGGEIENYHQQQQIQNETEQELVSTPTTPTAAAAIAAAKFSYFDTTIEEEDDEEFINIQQQKQQQQEQQEQQQQQQQEPQEQQQQQLNESNNENLIDSTTYKDSDENDEAGNEGTLNEANNTIDSSLNGNKTNNNNNNNCNTSYDKDKDKIEYNYDTTSTVATAKNFDEKNTENNLTHQKNHVQIEQQQQQQQQQQSFNDKSNRNNHNQTLITNYLASCETNMHIVKTIANNLHESNDMENIQKINNKEIKKIIPSNMRLHDDDLSNIDVKSLKKIYLMEQPPVNRKFKENTKQYQIPLNRSVSVKQLCRSFGDLTAIKAYGSNDNLKRAKSVSDVRSIEIGISVKQLKSSFSKFDALQKKNILHVRSSDAGKAQEKFNDVNSELEKNCRSCGKTVYKMEEIKAEKCIWHRNCFKCNECGKQLNVDTYQSHESVLYCKPHFKLLFAPKAVENNEPVKPKKPELIIRENQPVELPPDVVRASDKPDLGLEELHQLDVRSRFQVFEHLQDQTSEHHVQSSIEKSPSGVTRSASILSKLAKFKAKGMDTGADEALSGIPLEQSSSEDEDEDEIDENDPDAALIRSKRMQKERPMSFGNMNDIKSKFEKGHAMTREERREERKQEIQNIRSRLFMGKQAKIKEMYQQAVAESEHGIVSTGKKPEIDIGDKAKSLKEKFEKGEIFNKEDDEDHETTNHKVQDEDMAVFEQGISKKSRSIFMELDASASKPPQLTPQPTTPRSADAKKNIQVSPLQSEKLKPFSSENVVKYDEKPDDIKIETSEISSKFKFFETYRPTEQKKKEFRITPPREGVVKMPSPDRENDRYIDSDVVRSNEKIEDPSVVAKTQTATKMLSLFRQMEQKKYERNDEGLKPLKQFTPPPHDNRHLYENDNSDDEYTDEEEEGEEEEEEESDIEKPINRYEDEYLKQAKLEARAKQLRAKFEKWEANEIRRELSNGNINVYENADESQIESAKTLRAKFESLREQNDNSPNRPKIQVNRFV